MFKKKIIPVLLAGTMAMGVLSGCVPMNESDVGEITEEQLAEIAPVSQEKVAALEAMPGYDSNDTWAIYVYMCGSDLESGGISRTSDITSLLVAEETDAYYAALGERTKGHIMQFIQELTEKNLTLPESIYREGKDESEEYEDVEFSGEESEEDEDLSFPGAASEDLEELMSVKLPENITFVIQTGGAGRWKQQGINPNKSQIFTYSADGLKKVSDQPIKNMGNPQTLEDFLGFCKDNYPADHKMMLFWDHGAGCFGYGVDETFGGDTLTLDEMHQAFSNVYPLNEGKQPFELIGFDACLMAALEVGDTFSDVAKYMVASEELEPGIGWDYSTWVKKLAEHPEMNGAQLGRAICDSFIAASVKQGIIENQYTSEVLTASVIDLSKVSNIYTAYEDFAKEAFRYSNEDVQVLSLIGRAANRSVKYGQSLYKEFNTIDLGTFMTNIADELPELDVSKVKQTVDDGVLYTRGTAYAQSSEGISVYFPTSMDKIGSLLNLLDYIQEVSHRDAVNCLYYYKVAGCLNEYYEGFAQRELGITHVNTWNAALADEIVNLPISINKNELSLTLNDDIAPFISDVKLRISKVDKDTMQVYNYGEDYLAYNDEDAMVYKANLSGSWISIDGNPLYADIIDVTDRVIRYSTPVKYENEKVYLIFAYDYEKGSFEVLGIQLPGESASVVGRNLQSLENGEELVPLYTGVGLRDTNQEIEGTKFTYQESSKIKDETLADGRYLAFFEFSDFRDEKHYSKIVEFSMKDGEIKKIKVRDDLAYMLY